MVPVEGYFPFFREDESAHTLSVFVLTGSITSFLGLSTLYFVQRERAKKRQRACWTHLVEECLLDLLIYKRTVTTAE